MLALMKVRRISVGWLLKNLTASAWIRRGGYWSKPNGSPGGRDEPRSISLISSSSSSSAAATSRRSFAQRQVCCPSGWKNPTVSYLRPEEKARGNAQPARHPGSPHL